MPKSCFKRFFILESISFKKRLEYKSLPVDGWIHPCIICDNFTGNHKVIEKNMNNYVYYICKECKHIDTEINYVKKKYKLYNKRPYKL